MRTIGVDGQARFRLEFFALRTWRLAVGVDVGERLLFQIGVVPNVVRFIRDEELSRMIATCAFLIA